MTDEIQKILDFMDTGKSPITAQSEERIIILQPEEIYMVRIEGGETIIYGKQKHYFSRKRLWEINRQLGNRFMQISKTTIINLSYMDSVEAGFNGTLLLKLKNGCRDYVSRKYLKNFKNYLGL
ncbi:MAG: LytTR family DNA-binding domain-containing protein [Eubacteriales bacterium]|nr:LytTR family DNA-binding domain-containing protein [Eubacteriales bacterium]